MKKQDFKEDFKEIELLIDKIPEVEIFGTMSEEDVALAEAELKIKLPVSFREYLKRWGNLSIGHIEYYGLTGDRDFKNSGMPNFVWYTLKRRADSNFPFHLIIFRDDNGEVYSCLNTLEPYGENECKITLWDNINRVEDETVNCTFSLFLLDEIEQYIEHFSN